MASRWGPDTISYLISALFSIVSGESDPRTEEGDSASQALSIWFAWWWWIYTVYNSCHHRHRCLKKGIENFRKWHKIKCFSWPQSTSSSPQQSTLEDTKLMWSFWSPSCNLSTLLSIHRSRLSGERDSILQHTGPLDLNEPASRIEHAKIDIDR